jgi:hypothetical protein
LNDAVCFVLRISRPTRGGFLPRRRQPALGFGPWMKGCLAQSAGRALIRRTPRRRFFFQVSIAVLLDGFHEANKAMRAGQALEAIRAKQAARQMDNPLDPLLLRLSKDFVDEADLSRRLRELFRVS